ncbi:alpha/beta hydrolase [Dankookia rubra]|uniref:Alpha/beta hydrolase n=1 Tax=Dankookia rubra TaxID=1442381 RepID=A0A4R5QB22_9PROT|nr:alpha/beta hydrolase [Dankookia rubra]TDH59561.1 alpha/beta hydrolase [Dankookia rubra]
MQLLHVNGYDMAYVEQGSGAPLVLLHGAMCDLRYWATQMEAFGRRYRTIAPSLRHFWPERWDGIGDDFTIQQHTEDVAAFAAALGTGPVHLIGHSRGGHVAFRVAQHFPDRVRALILAEPGGELDATLAPEPPHPGMPAGIDIFGQAAERIRCGDIDGGVALFVDAVSGPGAWEALAERSRETMRENAYTLLGQVREQRPPFSRSDAEAIRAPTLLVGAERSPPTYARILGALGRTLWQAQRVTILGTSHAMNHGNPEAFNRAVLDFLDAQPPGSLTRSLP